MTTTAQQHTRMLAALREFVRCVEYLPGMGYSVPVFLSDAADDARAVLRDVEEG